MDATEFVRRFWMEMGAIFLAGGSLVMGLQKASLLLSGVSFLAVTLAAALLQYRYQVITAE